MRENLNYVRLGSSYIFKKKLLYGEDDIYYFMVGGKAFTDSSCISCKVSKGIPSKGVTHYPPCCMMDRNEICVEVDGGKTYNRYVNLITTNLSLFLVSYDRSVRMRDK